jgi:hypothetical protein
VNVLYLNLSIGSNVCLLRAALAVAKVQSIVGAAERLSGNGYSSKKTAEAAGPSVQQTLK